MTGRKTKHSKNKKQIPGTKGDPTAAKGKKRKVQKAKGKRQKKNVRGQNTSAVGKPKQDGWHQLVLKTVPVAELAEDYE